MPSLGSVVIIYFRGNQCWRCSTIRHNNQHSYILKIGLIVDCGIYSTCVNHHLYCDYLILWSFVALLFSFQFFDYVTCHCSNYAQTIDVYDGANCMNASRVVSYELVFSLFNYSHSSFTYRFDHGSFLYHLNSTDCKYDIGISYPLS